MQLNRMLAVSIKAVICYLYMATAEKDKIKLRKV